MQLICVIDQVLKIHAYMNEASVEASLKEHVNSRVAAHYPDTGYNSADGQVLPEIKSMV